MKTQIVYTMKAGWLVAVCLFLSLTPGCYDSDEVGDNFYTFTGETLGSYLENNSDMYSEFFSAVEKVGLKDLLRTYNKYTCFAPTNEAMRDYYLSEGVGSLAEMDEESLQYMVYSHLIADKVYMTTDFSNGALSTTNMNSRYLVVGRKAEGAKVAILINTNSTILEEDIVVENGIIHSIDRVLTPSTAALADLMLTDERVSLFAQALQATKISELMNSVRDDDYTSPTTSPLSIDDKTVCRWPKERKIGYTCFVETNEVLLAAFQAEGLNSGPEALEDLETLKQYAAKLYDAMYPDDKHIDDITDRRNSLNRFVAYHVVDKTVHYNNFFYKANMVSGASLYEFMETFCPNTLLKVSNDRGGVVINSDLNRSVQGVNVLPIESGYEQDTDNGIYHLIDGVLAYTQQVKTMLLNTRIRLDAASLHPELMTNGIRYEKGDNGSGVTGAANYYLFPDGYLKNVEFKSSNTRLYYLQGNTTWCNYQADEMMALGQFDFIMRLPPVPAGTYEVRFGYTANSSRGILQFYVDNDKGELEPRGIPLNMKMLATDARIGWVKDSETTDDGVENDKMMRNRGFMKGGSSYLNSSVANSRDHNGALRRIVCTETWTKDGPHYLRFKNVATDDLAQFMIDYFELVPKNVYDNVNGETRD